MNRKKFISLASVIIIIFLLILPKIKNKNDNALQSNPRIRQLFVKATVIKPKYLQNKIFSNGALMSNEEVELRTEIAGKIIQILFEEGKHVKRGDLLVKINDAELQATLKKNKSRETLARDKEFRYRQLLEKNLTSQQEYDIALSELNSVLADIEYTLAQIEKTEIRAPFDGIIGLRSVSVGSYISPQTKIATLQNINPIKVDFSVPQKYFGQIKPGKAIYIKVSSTGKTYTGKIYAVEPKIEQNTRAVQARAIVPNEKGELTPGAYVEIEIILEEFNNAILVPSETLVPDFEGDKVFVYRNGKAIPQRVTTGIRTEEQIQILEGLNIGDTLITSGIIQLKANANVKLTSVN